MDDRVLREMNVVPLHVGLVRLESNTAIITRDGVVFVADQGIALDVRGWPADWAAAAVDARKAELEAAGVRVTDLREPVALRRTQQAFEQAYERELYRREVESLSGHTPAAA
ncbi:MAG TPA: hypothetical protein VG370_26440 [Chloroflexota bacterium]|nr:hypothetical protein [Chloroflexota bacterium]